MICPVKLYSKFSDWYKEGGLAYAPSPNVAAGSNIEWIYKHRAKCKSPGVSGITPINFLGIL